MNTSIFPDRPLLQSGGRIDANMESAGTAFNLYREYENRRNTGSYANEAITNIHVQNDISSIYFSQVNIDVLQDAIRHNVYKASCGKHVIDRQSDNDLKIVMRSIYLDYAEHKAYNILEQVKVLNSRVIDFCVPKIMQEIGMYIYYKNDISKLPDPITRGQFVSSKGEKVNEIKSFY